jgi:hypothetical protein
LLERGDLRLDDADPVLVGVLRRVQHKRSDPVGELMGVLAAELRPVRPSDVRQLRVPEGLPKKVEIPCRVLGVERRGAIAQCSQAAVVLVVEGPGRVGPALCRLQVWVLRWLVVCRRVTAVDRSGIARPAGVERDDVELLEEIVREPAHPVGQETQAGRPGSARVQHQCADPVGGAGLRCPDDLERDLIAAGLCVIDRHLQGAAGEREPVQPVRGDHDLGGSLVEQVTTVGEGQQRTLRRVVARGA